MSSALIRPDVLVLAGGGVVGEAWMHGVLAGVEDAAGADFRQTELFVGTSAGSIVAARLASGRRPPRPDERPIATDAAPADDVASGGVSPGSVLRGAARVGWALSAPVTGAAVRLSTPVGAVARAAVLGRVEGKASLAGLVERVDRWGVRFDGRLRVCAVDRRSGRRVVFGAPGAPAASVAEAVAASCAIPWVFAPIAIAGREYVDGGAWSVTNLDAARAGRGTQVLCLDPSGALTGAVRTGLRAATELERQGLRRRGAQVHHVGPDAAAAVAIGANLMDAARRGSALAAGYRQGRELATSSS